MDFGHYPSQWASQYDGSLNTEVNCTTKITLGVDDMWGWHPVFFTIALSEMYLELAKRDDIEALRIQ